MSLGCAAAGSAIVATAGAADGNESCEPVTLVSEVEVPEYGTWYSELDGDESGHVTSSSDSIGKYTDIEENMFNYM